VTPVAREVSAAPELSSLFFARYNVPRWQVRFRVLGEPSWVDGPVRDRVCAFLEPLKSKGFLEGNEFATYQREYERYGGVEGMALAEKIFLHDTLACLELMEAERQGLTVKSRREFSMVMTERLLDLLRFTRAQRLAFYAFGYSWALDMKTWEQDEIRILDERFEALRPGLTDLFFGGQADDPVAAWGGEAPARIATRCLDATRPVVDELLAAHAAGRIKQDIVYLAWSYTHMQCNRLGIDPTPEAILRYFMHRLLKEKAVESA
jgi:class I lanthipeptide synthase